MRVHRPGTRSGREQVPFALVLALVAFAMVRIFQYHWREGAVLIAVALLLAALLRAVLADAGAGLIAIRSRRIDVLFYTGFGLLILFVALTITGGPLD